MANFVAVVDPIGERRERFLRDAGPQLELVEGLRGGRFDNSPFGAVWVASHHAPIEIAESGAAGALLFGDALDRDGRMDAETLLRHTTAAPPPAFDGFHAALISDDQGGLVAVGDRLGLFPIFHASSLDGAVVIVGSSPELFRLHPLFPARAGERGLVGLLLAHGIVGGRTLLEGVRRLAVGHALVHSPDEGSKELGQFEIEASVDLDPLDFDAHVERLDRQWRTTLERHVPSGQTVGLLLSGGRDSRLIAGYLANLGRDVRALSLGRASDYEARCAAAVARSLAFEHRRVDVCEARLEEWALLQARWEHLSAGFSSVHTWAAVPAMQTLASHCVSGYLREVREVPLGTGGLEEVVGGPYGRGIGPGPLRTLLRPAFAGLVDEVLDNVRALWETSSPDPDDRGWRFLLKHGWRAHPGGVLWRFSFGSWPVLPMLDQQLLELTASIPTDTLVSRRAQDALLRHHFVRLARLDLDRNGYDTMPLQPTRLRWMANPGLARLRRFRRRVLGRRAERRYYYRVYDLETDGWRAVRQRAEPGRIALTRVFDPEALERVLPPPPAPLRLKHPIRDGFVPKLLLGLMLWATEHPI